MSILSVFDPSSPELPNKVLTHHDDIVATLAEQGLRFGRWQSGARLRPGSSQAEVLEACRQPLDQLMTAHGSAAFAVLSREGAIRARMICVTSMCMTARKCSR